MPKTILELEQERAALEQTLTQKVVGMPDVQKKLSEIEALPANNREVAKKALLGQTIENYKSSMMKVLTKEALTATEVPETIQPIIERIHIINNDIARLQMGADALITQADKERLAQEEQQTVEQSFAEIARETGTAHTGAPIMHDPIAQAAEYSTDSALDAETGKVQGPTPQASKNTMQKEGEIELSDAQNAEIKKAIIGTVQDIASYITMSREKNTPLKDNPLIMGKIISLNDWLAKIPNAERRFELTSKIEQVFRNAPEIQQHIGRAKLQEATVTTFNQHISKFSLGLGALKINDPKLQLEKIPGFKELRNFINEQSPLPRVALLGELKKAHPEFPIVKYFSL